MNKDKPTAFEKYNEKYKKGYCTEEQLQQLVELGVITEKEYEEIISSEVK